MSKKPTKLPLVGASSCASLVQCDDGATWQRNSIPAALLAVVLLAVGAPARSAEIATTCTNVTSGTSWQLKIDYERGTVDSNPARISDTQIVWRDAKDGGNYTLDRKSGDLTIIVASSTGGAFFYHRCKLTN